MCRLLLVLGRRILKKNESKSQSSLWNSDFFSIQTLLPEEALF